MTLPQSSPSNHAPTVLTNARLCSFNQRHTPPGLSALCFCDVDHFAHQGALMYNTTTTAKALKVVGRISYPGVLEEPDRALFVGSMVVSSNQDDFVDLLLVAYHEGRGHSILKKNRWDKILHQSESPEITLIHAKRLCKLILVI